MKISVGDHVVSKTDRSRHQVIDITGSQIALRRIYFKPIKGDASASYSKKICWSADHNADEVSFTHKAHLDLLYEKPELQD